MTQRVWKYAIANTYATQTVLMPHISQPVHFGTVHDQLFMWALVDEDTALTPAYFALALTGMQLPSSAMYVGSAALQSEVLHLFWLTERKDDGDVHESHS